MEKQALETAFKRLAENGIEYYVNLYYGDIEKENISRYLGFFLLYAPDIIKGNFHTDSIEKLKALEGAVFALILTDEKYEEKNPEYSSTEDILESPNIFDLIALNYKRSIGEEPFTEKELKEIIYNLSRTYDKNEYSFTKVNPDKNMIYRCKVKLPAVKLSWNDKIKISATYSEEEALENLYHFYKEELEESIKKIVDNLKKNKSNKEDILELFIEQLKKLKEENSYLPAEQIIEGIILHFEEEKWAYEIIGDIKNEITLIGKQDYFESEIVYKHYDLFTDFTYFLAEDRIEDAKNIVKEILEEADRKFIFPIINYDAEKTYKFNYSSEDGFPESLSEYTEKVESLEFDPEEMEIKLYLQNGEEAVITDITGLSESEQRKILLEYIEQVIEYEGEDEIYIPHKRPFALLIEDIKKGTKNYSNVELLSMIGGIAEEPIRKERINFLKQKYKEVLHSYRNKQKIKL